MKLDAVLGEKKLAEPVIRRVRNNELSDVLEMWQLAGVTPPSVSDSIEGLTCLLREPAAFLLVATIDDQIVGSVIGGWDGWRGNIYRLAVMPEFRRMGIARRLVAEISRELFAKGATRLSALTEHEHQWAMDFWDSVSDLGYERDPKFARYIADSKGRKMR
jgi:ribosomal protein S18 acetylase RimI-like enzyme